MTDRIPFNAQDKPALCKLDDAVTIDTNNKLAVISGMITVEIIRDGEDRFRLRFQFPGEPLDVKIRRVQLLEQLGIAESES